MVNGINGSNGIGNSLKNVLQSFQKEQEASAAELLSGAAPSASSNVMSRNFASMGHEESRYVKAAKIGFQSDSNMVNRQSAILTAGLAELAAMGEEGGYAARVLIGKKAARRLAQEQQQTASEESERNLKEIKDGIEQRAEEAMAPKDAEGKSAENKPAEAAAEAAPTQEASGAEPASAADVAAAPTPEAAPKPEVATPAVPSIDITV